MKFVFSFLFIFNRNIYVILIFYFQARAVADLNQRDFLTQHEQEEKRVSIQLLYCVLTYSCKSHLGYIQRFGWSNANFVCFDQRIAESLDIDIKRWAAGKEGNMRALLSSLQYVCLLVLVFLSHSNVPYLVFVIFYFSQ